MAASSLPTLPDDCVFDVLQYLSAEDLARLSSTCRAWNRLSEKNSLWQRLCLERWRTWPPPRPFSSYHNRRQLDRMLNGVSRDSLQTEPSFPPEVLPDLCAPRQWYTTSLPPYEMDLWKDVYRERHQKDVIVRKLLKEMVEDSRNRMRHTDGIASIGMVHARDILENIIAGRNGEERDLTRTFYARRTLKRLRRGWVLSQWRAYRSSQQNFPVWQGCALMAMFSDHEMELSDIDHQFQDLADEFLALSPLPNLDYTLGEQYSRHYIAQTERLRHLVRFFTQDKSFKGNTENYYDPFNSFIDKVLLRKVGIPISLCIVFSELAYRVGIVGVDLMGFPQHFMIRFRPGVSTIGHTSRPLAEPDDSVITPPAPTYYLDLFHPPHRLLSTEEYENYFSSLNIPQPPNVYRDLPTPPLEIFLRCLRNIILAVEQRGGAGRIGSDNHMSLYSGITQLLALHPGEEWGIYLLWLKYLSNFWPEDVGFIRTSIEDMELIGHRRSVSRGHAVSPLQSQQRQQHVFGYRQGTFHSTAAPAPHFGSSTYETIKILRAQVRELEMADEVGEVRQIRRRRRPKVASAAPIPPGSPPTPPPPPSALGMHVSRPIDHSGRDISMQTSVSSPTASSPTIDAQSSHGHNQQERQNSISGEQQSGAQESSAALGEDDHENNRPRRLSPTFGGGEPRRPEPEYYVGEVFRHLIYRYTGAIYGYDLKCEADENWILSMGIDSLVHGRNQPFYNALLSDSSRRYVAQENIQVLFRNCRSAATSTHDADHIPTNSNLATALESPPTTTSAPPTLAPTTTTEATTQAHEPVETTAGIAPFNLQFSELGPLGIETVGQYFEAWDGKHGHYVMNKELRKAYPTEDYQ